MISVTREADKSAPCTFATKLRLCRYQIFMTVICLCSIVLIQHAAAEAESRDSFIMSVRRFSLSAVRVSAQPSSRTGTGFWVGLSEDTSKTIFITNKHLLHDAKQLKLTFQLSDQQERVVDTSTRIIDLYSMAGDSLFVVSKTSDITAIVIRTPYAKGKAQAICGIHDNSFCLLTHLFPGEPVLFFGYPLGMTVNHVEPILRTGTIAGVDTSRSVIYLDAQVFAGSSGSPVFVDPRGSLGATPTFVGVIAGYKPYEKFLANVETGKVEMKQSENSGLAIVMPATEIRKVAMRALTRATAGATK